MLCANEGSKVKNAELLKHNIAIYSYHNSNVRMSSGYSAIQMITVEVAFGIVTNE